MELKAQKKATWSCWKCWTGCMHKDHVWLQSCWLPGLRFNCSEWKVSFLQAEHSILRTCFQNLQRATNDAQLSSLFPICSICVLSAAGTTAQVRKIQLEYFQISFWTSQPNERSGCRIRPAVSYSNLLPCGALPDQWTSPIFAEVGLEEEVIAFQQGNRLLEAVLKYHMGPLQKNFL